MKKIYLILTGCIGLLILIIVSLSMFAVPSLDQPEEPTPTDLSGAVIQVIAPAPSNTLYVGLTGNQQPTGIYRSDDNGRSWQIACSGPGLTINALLVHPNDEAVLYAGTAGGPIGDTHSLWRSQDRGQRWQPFSLDLPANSYGLIPTVTALAFDPNQPETLYIGTDGDG